MPRYMPRKSHHAPDFGAPLRAKRIVKEIVRYVASERLERIAECERCATGPRRAIAMVVHHKVYAKARRALKQ